MARRADTEFPDEVAGAIRAVFAVFLLAAAASSMPAPARAYLLSDESAHNRCRIAASSAVPDPICDWTFETIARVRAVAASRADELANLGRLERAGFTTSDLTLEEIMTEPVPSREAVLTWDREVGIADQLSAAMDIAVDWGADCSKKELKVEPARLYFRTDWPCRYTPRRAGDGSGPR